MANSDPRVDAYIANQAAFARPILSELRRRMHAAVPEIDEGIKWSMPFFVLKGRPFANMAAFKAHASFGFWNRSDTATGKEGEAMGQFGRLTSVDDLPPEKDFTVLVHQAVAAASGSSARPRAATKAEIEVPAPLTDALANDAVANATWQACSPGSRREYCQWVAEAKRPETRDRRVAQTIAQLREGKRINWKYEK